MQQKQTTQIDTSFMEDVRRGLTAYPKFLYSKYFYDKKGDALFQKIMGMPEYYLTNCEFEILQIHKREIIDQFLDGVDSFDLIELGAGDGKKTKILLQHLRDRETNFQYMPIDISQNALDSLEASIEQEIPGIIVEPRQGTYFEMLEQICEMEQGKKVILFLGSNIGNLLHQQAVDFLKGIRDLMSKNDLLFIGFDQKKNPQTVLNAYNDSAGITEEFNKNLLRRMNRELQANFDPDKFLHWEVYDPETGTAKSFLVAKEAHTVIIDTMKMEVPFNAWETIHMEISQKYDDEVVQWLATKAGLRIKTSYTDSNSMYKDYILIRE